MKGFHGSVSVVVEIFQSGQKWSADKQTEIASVPFPLGYPLNALFSWGLYLERDLVDCSSLKTLQEEEANVTA